MTPLDPSRIKQITSIYCPTTKQFVGCGSMQNTTLLLIVLDGLPASGGLIREHISTAWALADGERPEIDGLLVRGIIKSLS